MQMSEDMPGETEAAGDLQAEMAFSAAAVDHLSLCHTSGCSSSRALVRRLTTRGASLQRQKMAEHRADAGRRHFVIPSRGFVVLMEREREKERKIERERTAIQWN